MPEASVVSCIHQHVGRAVLLRGWCYNLRGSGKVAFLQLRDGTGIVQCVAAPDVLGEETFDQVRRLGQESSLEVEGTVHADPRAPGGHEIQVTILAREILFKVPTAGTDRQSTDRPQKNGTLTR